MNSGLFGRRNVLLTLLFLILGAGLMTVRSSLPPRFLSVDDFSREAPRETYEVAMEQLEGERKDLLAQVGLLRGRLRSYQEATAQRSSSLDELNRELEGQQAIAGLTPLTGPGVRVTVDDSPRTPQPNEDINHYLVHDYQLRDVLNLLWRGGAEAVSINGERVVITTSIYCVGSTVVVNNARLSPPYRFHAIGDADSLGALATNPGSLSELKSEALLYGVVFQVEKSPALAVPAYSGAYGPRYARLSSQQ